MKVVVATHGHCFDGLASAVVFTKLLRHLHGPDIQFEYHACGYGTGQKVATPGLLRGDLNAILDYRFCATESLDWYFDHHRTAFASEEDRAFFANRKPGGQYFFEPDYSSCTKLIADLAATRF